MKRFIFLIILAFFMLVIQCCNGNKNTNKLKEYDTFKSDISDKVKYKMPSYKDFEYLDSKKGETYSIIFPAAIKATNFSSILILKKYSTANFLKALDSVKSSGVKVNMSECVRIIPISNAEKNEELLQFSSILEKNIDSAANNNKANNTCCKKTIPNIHNPLFISEYYSLGKGIDFYIFKSETGEFLSDNYKSYYYNTKNICHGYSSGAFVDNTSLKIGYWLLIW